MNYVLNFSEEAAENIVFTGGKGANLSKLTRNAFNVPPGFIVTSQAYKDFMTQEKSLKKYIDEFDHGNPEKLKSQSEELKKRLRALSMPSAIKKAIEEALSARAEIKAFSVRSSSTLEDLSSAAFAGQHDTFLNCIGAEEIIAKVKECFISLWHDRAVAYRNQKGFSHLDASMAVVIQKMIQAESAGVAFSVNPVSGNIKQVLINSNFGLGESVVSGESNADHFVVNKDTLSVEETLIAQKSEKILSDIQGVKSETLSAEDSTAASIGSEQVKEIARLNIQTEKYYGFPQDIEWAFEKGTLYILQARPITTIQEYWTRDESAERYPNAITPFTWDFMEKGFHISLKESFKIMGFPSFDGKWFKVFNNYVYGNQNAVWLYMGQNPLAIKNIDDLINKMSFIKDKFSYVQDLPIMWARDLDKYLLGIGALMAEDLSAKSESEIWDYITRIFNLGTEYFRPNIAISITQSMLYKVFIYILTMVTQGNDNEAKKMFDTLIFTNETKTSLVNYELYLLAQAVKADAGLKDIFMRNASKEIISKNMLERFGNFNKMFSKFLADHGHRETDIDAYIPTWVEAQDVVLDNIRLILNTAMETDPKDKEYDMKYACQKAEAELFQKTPEKLHLFLYEIIRLVRVYTSLDDIEHYQTTRLTLPMRKGVKALGKLLENKKIVEDAADVFFSHTDTLEQYIAGKLSAGDLKLEIKKEKEAYLKNRDITPSWILNSCETCEDIVDLGDTLSGVAGSPGIAEGEIFIVRSTEDFSSFPKHAVLVAKTTNPAWTPLFYNASAVITESGGALSHGAVTAREMKVPAVMSVRNVMQKLKNGQKVKVDGSKGKVYIL